MGAITDIQIGWKTCRQFIPIRSFAGFDNNGTSDISLSQGTPTLEPASGTLEVATLPMTTADEVHTVMPIPWNMNRDKPVLGRVFFIHASTDADDQPVFKVGVKFYAKQDQTVEAKANADADVSITAPATSSTDDSLEVTDWTDLEWDENITPDDILAAITLELDALGSASADECEVLGIELMWEISACDSYRHKTETEIYDNPV